MGTRAGIRPQRPPKSIFTRPRGGPREVRSLGGGCLGRSGFRRSRRAPSGRDSRARSAPRSARAPTTRLWQPSALTGVVAALRHPAALPGGEMSAAVPLPAVRGLRCIPRALHCCPSTASRLPQSVSRRRLARHQLDDDLPRRLVLVEQLVHLLRDRHLDVDALRQLAHGARVVHALRDLLHARDDLARALARGRAAARPSGCATDRRCR